MANLLSRAVRRHHAGLLAAASVDAVYRRGSDSLAMVLIALGIDTETDDVDDVFASTKRRDFGVAADDLILGGIKIEPAEGDFIDCDSKRYAVVPIERGRCFRSMDNLGILSRVFTVETGDTPA